MASARLIRQASSLAAPTVSAALDSHDEEQPLLDDDENEHTAANPTQPRAPNVYADLPVYQNIWRIRQAIISSIKDPYSLEQLRAPRLNTTVVRPLMEELYDLQDISILYCLLVNRMQFLEEQSYQAHYLSVNSSRARLAELLALKILRQYDEDSTGQKGLLLLTNILIAGFEPFQNAPPDLAKTSTRSIRWPAQDRGGYERHSTALEVAIISNSKFFLSSPACQKVIDAIYVGRIVYTPTSFIDIIPDHYKHRSISIYEPKRAPLLNQYRLNVPRTRNALEVLQFVVLLVLFILVMNQSKKLHFTVPELLFCIYTWGWLLDQLASIMEHGWRVYSSNLWSFLDFAFGSIFLIYFALRVHGIQTGNIQTGRPALDVLAMAAPFLIPRLAFNLFSENLLFVSLREMMSKFLLLTFLAVWSFTGFFLAMLWLGGYRHHPVTVGKWMIWVWFGLDGTGIQRSVEFHPFLGPILMIAFAIFGNTLFLTILVSTLSHTFSRITKSSDAEVAYRRALMCVEGVKSDAIFFYQPPFNILALCILLPLKLAISQRWFHKIHITFVRVLNGPLLILLNSYERRALWPANKEEVISQARRHKQARTLPWTDFSRFHVHGDIRAVFDAEPSETVHRRSIQWQEDEVDAAHARTANRRANSNEISSPKHSKIKRPQRKESVWSIDGLESHVAGLIHEHGEHGGGGDVVSRLDALESSTRRIEEMLNRISESMDNNDAKGDDES